MPCGWSPRFSHHLQPVAGQHVADDLPQLMLPLTEVQPGQEGNWLWPQIGPDEAPISCT